MCLCLQFSKCDIVTMMEPLHHRLESPLVRRLQVQVAVSALLDKVPGEKTPGKRNGDWRVNWTTWLSQRKDWLDHLMISPLQYSIPWNWQRFGSLRWLRENHNGCFIWIKHVWLEKQYVLGKVKTKNYQRQETCKTCSGPSLWWRGPCLCKPYNMRS